MTKGYNLEYNPELCKEFGITQRDGITLDKNDFWMKNRDYVARDFVRGGKRIVYRAGIDKNRVALF